jgi:hypothetical protein
VVQGRPEFYFNKTYLQLNDEITFVADGGDTALTPTHITIPFASSNYKQCKMALDSVTPNIKLCCITQFLVKNNKKPTEVLCR